MPFESLRTVWWAPTSACDDLDLVDPGLATLATSAFVFCSCRASAGARYSQFGTFRRTHIILCRSPWGRDRNSNSSSLMEAARSFPPLGAASASSLLAVPSQLLRVGSPLYIRGGGPPIGEVVGAGAVGALAGKDIAKSTRLGHLCHLEFFATRLGLALATGKSASRFSCCDRVHNRAYQQMRDDAGRAPSSVLHVDLPASLPPPLRRSGRRTRSRSRSTLVLIETMHDWFVPRRKKVSFHVT